MGFALLNHQFSKIIFVIEIFLLSGDFDTHHHRSGYSTIEFFIFEGV